MKRAFIMVLDSFGIGHSKDAHKYNDEGADTLGHIAAECAKGNANQGRCGVLNLPNLAKFGLVNAAFESTGKVPDGMQIEKDVIGAYGYASEISTGKDTPSGHWEIAGVPVLFDWGYFKDVQNSFPQDLLDRIVKRANLKGYLGNCHSSGTQILDELGLEHMASGKPIFYTSADSVFQIACHEETYGLDNLYELCEIARDELNIGNYNIGRVIARPFLGDKPGEFVRTGNRHDLAVEPPSPTILKKMVDERDGTVVSIGKIADIYAHVGITHKVKATGLEELFDKTLIEMQNAEDNSIVFTNFVDFDSSYGHRRDVPGYAAALEYFDSRLPEMLALVKPGDLLILTADHGCDPTWAGNDHTREHIPILVYSTEVKPGYIGYRETFADIGQTVADYLNLSPMDHGKSFLTKQ